ncbi:rRNA maturation RNase YbeY [Candidatus Daviesbacteria bacterium]|nr:rRNA maturation RNase YbeY [Candidatus Daviesbacteria bacterium]
MVNIIVNSDPRYPVNKLSIQASILEVLQQHKVTGNVEIGVSIVGDRKMHEFNKKYRGLDGTTNILSFALEDPISASQLQHIPRVGFVKAPDKVLRLGDILISYPQVLKDASMEGLSIEEELTFLIEHGMKHLLGIHHD